MSVLLVVFLSAFSELHANPRQDETSNLIEEVAFVESPTDTDFDGTLDRIYIKITREKGKNKLPVMYTISPYALGGNNVSNHSVDVALLPQDEQTDILKKAFNSKKSLKDKHESKITLEAIERGYASISAHSLGTGNSTGCPTVGDESETLAAKSVIDWLNGRADAFNESNKKVTASWANGSVGMIGVSYNGTLPNMVAATGVDGLKAIIPIAAISNWYDYYRANGLVVGPGGYIGEDADILGKFIVRKDACTKEMRQLTVDQGRNHGDFDEFWQARDYVKKARNLKAAVFIMHGQSDWNVRQRHAIQWWHALDEVVPRRMWLHKGGHDYPNRSDLNSATWSWFDRYVKGIENGVENEPIVEVEANGIWTKQAEWPAESTLKQTLYLNAQSILSETYGSAESRVFVDEGKNTRLEQMINSPSIHREDRLVFVTNALSSARLLSGTPRITLKLSVQNRKAANITVAILEYDAIGKAKVITRGWADPQNHSDLGRGEWLTPGEKISLSFELEPKQYRFDADKRIGIIVTSTDYEHTLRPNPGTQIELDLGPSSFIELDLSQD